MRIFVAKKDCVNYGAGVDPEVRKRHGPRRGGWRRRVPCWLTDMSFVKCRRLEYLQGGAVTRSPLLTAAACERIRELADADAAARGGWGSGADYAYATRDQVVEPAGSRARVVADQVEVAARCSFFSTTQPNCLGLGCGLGS